MKIVVFPEKNLRKKSIEVENIDKEFLKFINIEFFEFMKNSDGVGLAAPQVDISKRFFAFDTSNLEGGIKRIVINPIILREFKEKISYEEGCLSVPGIFANVERKEKIEVEYINGEGKEVIEVLDGMNARVFLHEYDHLEGILFIDRLNNVEYMKIKGNLKKLKKK